MSGLVGRTIRSYQLVEQIGAGVPSLVFRAKRDGQRDVAVKVVLPEFANRPEFIRRFEAEVRLVMRLSHPHIVSFSDYWRDPSGAYLVMPLMQSSLREVIDAHPSGMALKPVLRIVEQIASGLMLAHSEGIVHRDIKPGNILLDQENNAYLSDFGIAKILTETEEHDLRSQLLQGTPTYISPEQVTGDDITPQADIYALGLVIFEMLTGRKAFDSDNAATLIRQHVEASFPSAHGLNPALPEKIDVVLQRMVAKQPKDRYSDTRSLFIELQAVLTRADLKKTQESPGLDVGLPVNPYRGLWPFDEADDDNFFGRDKLVDRLLARLGDIHGYGRFLALVGARGVGKTSILNAGLIPALRNGRSTVEQNWYIAQMTPGTAPLKKLQYALVSLSQDADLDVLVEQLQDSHTALDAVIEQLLPDQSPLLLIIDQFEEIFAHTVEQQERKRILSLIHKTVTAPQGRIWIVIAVRADYITRLLQIDGYGDLLQQRTEFVLSLAPHELELAIAGPAQRLGLDVDRDLQKVALAHVRGETDALSLLQFALRETFDARSNNHLTLSEYMSRGGALKALSQRCEDIFSALDENGQQAMYLLLTEMSQPTERNQGTILCSLSWPTFRALAEQQPQVVQVRDLLVNYRILQITRDPKTREPLVILPNEVLLHRWDRLRGWLSERDDDGNTDVMERRLIRERRIRRQLQGLVALLLIVFGISVGAAWTIAQQGQQTQQQYGASVTQVAALATESAALQQELQDERQQTDVRALETDSRRLAFYVTQALIADDDELARALAVAAVDVEDPPAYAVELLAFLLGVEDETTPSAVELLNLADKEFETRELSCEERDLYRVAPLCEQR